MTMPSVTFLIAARNAAGTISAAVNSAMNQDYAGDVRVVVIDDASMDGTSDRVPSLDGVTLLHNDRQLGRSGSRNKGLAIVDTDLIAIQDADDVSLPNRLSATVPLSLGGQSVVGSQLVWFDPRRGPYEGAQWPVSPVAASLALAAFRTPVSHPSMLLPTELIRSVDGYNEQFPVGEDLDLMLRLYKKYPELEFRNAELPTVVYSRQELDSFAYTLRSSYWRHRIAAEYRDGTAFPLTWIFGASERYARQRVRWLRRRFVTVREMLS